MVKSCLDPQSPQQCVCKVRKKTSLPAVGCKLLQCLVFATLIASGGIFYWNYSLKTAMLERRLQQVEMELNLLQTKLSSSKARQNGAPLTGSSRVKRQMEAANWHSGAAVPIIEDSYREEEKRPTEGLRIYDTWFQDQDGIPHADRRQRHKKRKHEMARAAIRPHHRKSASWVETERRSKHNVNPHFDETRVYRNPYPYAGSQSSSRDAIDLPQKNRAKETNELTPDMVLQTMAIHRVVTPSTSPSLPSANSFLSSVRSNRSEFAAHSRVMQNKINVKSLEGERRHHRKHHKGHHYQGGSHTSSSVGPIKNQFHGLLSIHFVANQQEGATSRSTNDDGVHRNWSAARWAKRMQLEQSFIYAATDGTVEVTLPGVYYTYVQINYLDENDVNAFQILVNGDPYLMCTVMTSTGVPSVSKANTCYTGGVMFLESGAKISVRDLESGRNSVVRPSHTFFGLVQLSGVDV